MIPISNRWYWLLPSVFIFQVGCHQSPVAREKPNVLQVKKSVQEPLAIKISENGFMINRDLKVDDKGNATYQDPWSICFIPQQSRIPERFKVSVSEINRFRQLMKETKFWQMKSEYGESNIPDVTASTIYVSLGNKTKTVTLFYIGDNSCNGDGQKKPDCEKEEVERKRALQAMRLFNFVKKWADITPKPEIKPGDHSGFKLTKAK